MSQNQQRRLQPLARTKTLGRAGQYPFSLDRVKDFRHAHAVRNTPSERRSTARQDHAGQPQEQRPAAATIRAPSLRDSPWHPVPHHDTMPRQVQGDSHAALVS